MTRSHDNAHSGVNECQLGPSMSNDDNRLLGNKRRFLSSSLGIFSLGVETEVPDSITQSQANMLPKKNNIIVSNLFFSKHQNDLKRGEIGWLFSKKGNNRGINPFK